MTTKYTEIPLFSDARYSLVIALQGINYRLSFSYNTRVAGWYMDINLEAGDVLASSIRLVPNYPLILDYKIPSLTGMFALFPKSTIATESYLTSPRQLDQYYTLNYIFED